MQKDMDTIQFESRREIEDIIYALDIFLEEHIDHHSAKEVKRLRDNLDVMEMEW